MTTDGVNLEAVLALYERERADIEREYQRRRSAIDIIVGDLREKIARDKTAAPSATPTEIGTGEYANVTVLEGGMQFLAHEGRAATAREIASAMLRGGYLPKGKPEDFHKSVYNTLRTEASKAHGRKVVQDDDKRFRLASQFPEPGPVPGIAFPSEEAGSVPPVFVPSGFGSAPSNS